MDLIHQDKFANYYLDKTFSLLIQEWTNDDASMGDDDYKHEMYNYLDFVKQYEIKRALINLKKFNYTIIPEMQKWVDDNITRYAIDIVDSIAFVLPNDLFIEVSVRQVMKEKNALYKNIEFFTSVDEALEWLKQH